MKVNRIIATLLAAVLITGSLPLNEVPVYAQEGDTVVETTVASDTVEAQEEGSDTVLSEEVTTPTEAGALADKVEKSEDEENKAEDIIFSDVTDEDKSQEEAEEVEEEAEDELEADAYDFSKFKVNGLYGDMSKDHYFAQPSQNYWGSISKAKETISPVYLSGIRFNADGAVVSQYKQGSKTVVSSFVAIDITPENGYKVVDVTAKIGDDPAYVEYEGVLEYTYKTQDGHWDDQSGEWIDDGVDATDYLGPRYVIWADESGSKPINGDVTFSVEVVKDLPSVTNIGWNEAKGISIRPDDYTDHVNFVTEPGNSGIFLSEKAEWDEDNNKFLDKKYYVKPDAKSVNISVSIDADASGNERYIDPSSVKAKIGTEDAVVKQINPTASRSNLFFTIQKDKNGTEPIDGNVEILVDDIQTLKTRKVTFEVKDDDQEISRLCGVDPVDKIVAYKSTVTKDNGKIIFENVPEGEVKFFLYPVQNYKVESATVGDNTLESVNEVFTLLGTDDKTVVLSIEPDETYEIPVSLENATATWGNKEKHVESNVDSKISTYYKKNVYLKVKADKGYSIGDVVMSAEGQSPTALREYEDGSADEKIYLLYETDKKGDHNFRIATGASISVNAVEKATKITATITNDGKPSSDVLTFTGGRNASYYDGKAFCEGMTDAVTLSYTIPADRELASEKSFVAKMGEEEITKDGAITVEQTGTTYKWTLSAETIADACKAGKDISISIATQTKNVKIQFDQTASGHNNIQKVYSYFKGTGSNDEINKNNPLSVPYGQEAYIYVLPKDSCIVKSVKAGKTALKSATETIRGVAFTYYIIPASVLKADTQITVTTDDRISINYTPNDNCTVKMNVSGAVYENETYKLPVNTKKVSYTIETVGNYVVSEIITKDLDDGTDPNKINPPTPAINKTKDGLVYTVTGDVGDYKGRELKVSTKEVTRKLEVPVTVNHIDSVSVRANGESINGTIDDGKCTFNIADPFATVIVTAAAEDGFKLTGKAALNGKSVSAAKGVVSTTLALGGTIDNINAEKPVMTTTLSFGTDPVLGLYVDGALTANNSTLSVDPYATDYSDPKISLKVGSDALTIDKVTVTPKGATLQDSNDTSQQFYTIANGIVTLHPVNNIINGAKPIKVAVEAKDSKGKKYTGNVSFNFKQEITSVTVKGVKNNELSQPLGTQVWYDITLNGNADINDLGVTVEDIDGKSFDADVEIDRLNNNLLHVMMFSKSTVEGKDHIGISEKTGPFYIKFKNSKNNPVGEKIKVTPTKTKFPAPTVTMTNASDTQIILQLGLPKNLPDHRNLVYHIVATASTKDSEGHPKAVGDMKDSDEWYIGAESDEVSTGAVALDLAKDDVEKGHGNAQKYDISVTLVQVDDMELGGNPGNGTKICNDTGTPKKLTASTRQPAYETKMGVTKKTTTFTKGQYELLGEHGETLVCVGMAKFSATTSYTNVDMNKTRLLNAEGNELAVARIGVENYKPVQLGADNLSLWVDTAVLTPGKATLEVYPELPSGTQCTPATIALTVKEPIAGITISPGGDKVKLFKQDGKAATIKFTATVSGAEGNKPASNKVKWALGNCGTGMTSGVSINEKTGVVTVNKDFVLTPGDVNWFEVKAIADDYPGSSIESAVTKVTVTNEALTIAGVQVSVPLSETEEEVIPAATLEKGVDNYEIKDAKIKFVDQTGAAIDLNNLTLKVSPAGLTIKPTGAIEATKAGKYTITATANDGAKSTFKCTINYLGRQISTGKLFIYNKDYAGIPGTMYFEKTDISPVEAGDLRLAYVEFYDSKNKEIKIEDLDLKITSGMTIDVLDEEKPSCGFFWSVKKEGTYKITAKPKDGSKSTKELSVTVKSSNEEYSLRSTVIISDYDFENKADVSRMDNTDFISGDMQNGGTVVLNNASGITMILQRTDSYFSYNASVTVKGGSIITKKTGAIMDGPGEYGYYSIKPTSDTFEVTLKYGKGIYAKTVKYVFINKKGNEEAVKTAAGTKTEFVGGSTAGIKTKFHFTTKHEASDDEQYRLSFVDGDEVLKTNPSVQGEENLVNLYTLSTKLNEAGKTVTISDNGQIIMAEADCGEVPAGSYQFYVTLLKVKNDGEGKETGTVPLTKPALITFKATAPKKVSAKLANSTSLTITDTYNETGTLTFTANSAFSSIKADSVKLYCNNDKGEVNIFTKLFKATPDGKAIKLTRENYGGSWSDDTKITGWVEYTVIGEDGKTPLTNCEKVTVTLKKGQLTGTN